MALSDDFADATVRHQVYLQRYKSGVVKNILKLLKNVEDDIISETVKRDLEAMSRRDLDKLFVRLRQIIKDGYKPIIAALDDEIKKLSAYEAKWQGNLFANVVPIDIDFVTPAYEQIYAAAVARPFQGRLLREWYQGLEDGQFIRVRAAIREGFVQGQTTQQIVQAIRGTRSQRGIIEQSRRGAEAAVRTALAHTANVARSEVYKKNRKVIKAVEWVSTLDGRTTAICRALDGKVYEVDKGPRPPAHVGCRSTTIPVVKSLRELGIKVDENKVASTRASMNGQVSSELNYDQWLRKQSQSFQDEVLGKSKAKLFRAGLTMDRFIDRKGNELTLDQLMALESAAWTKAGL